MNIRGRIKPKFYQKCSACLIILLLIGAVPVRAELVTDNKMEFKHERLTLSNTADGRFDESIEKDIDLEERLVTKSELELPNKTAPSALNRILAEDSFDNGDNWDVTNAGIVTFREGKAHIKGGGPNNRMGYNQGKIAADNFLIELDMTTYAGNTNANAKIGFKAASYDGERLQLRFDFPKNKVILEKTNGWNVSADFSQAADQTYQVSILVSDDTVTAYINGAEILSKTESDIAQMEQGYFVVSGQYPAQDFSIDNLQISTDEMPEGEEYTVTLKTACKGVIDENESVGGSLTANKLTGYAGDTITLYPVAKHGYEFEKYTSFKADGTPTDGLMPITNHRFTLNEKFGNVTVIAHFKERLPGRFELFYDDFGTDAVNGERQYARIKNEEYATLKNGELVLDVEEENNYVLLDQKFFEAKKPDEGYRVAADVRRGNTASGTVQIMFKGSDQDVANRYVLAVNTQGAATLRHFLSDGSNVELKRCDFSWPAAGMVNMELEINGDTVTFLADGLEKMSYTNHDSWSDMEDAAGLINVTDGAPAIFDNFSVERIPKTKTLEIIVKYEKNGVLIEDTTNQTGTVTSSEYRVMEGDEVKLTTEAKAGWKLKECYGENVELTITDGIFLVPSNAPETISITAVFEPEALREAETFYIDSQAGSDSNPGTSETAPWQTISRLTELEKLVPGDKILLKRGSEFNGVTLMFQGMGTKDNPIVIDAYGTGDNLPCLNGNGQVENVVSLFNQEYIEIRNLEITNTDPGFNSTFFLNGSNNTSKTLRAINVSLKDFGVASGIVIENCYIHDINGNINLKWNGGIFFDIKADIKDGKLVGIPSKYDNIIIEGCTFERIDRSAIKLVSSSWCNQWEKNSPGVPINWYPSTNVIIRGNYMEKIGGDGITNRDTDGALIEHNLVRDCRYQNTGYNVGIWPFEASNTVIQYNEAYNTHGTTDGQGLDCDHASSYSVMQYNYSHNNEGGFMLIMGGYPHTSPTVRYNISQNDRDKTFEFAQGIPNGTMIYNNTIFSDKTIGRGVFYLSNSGVGQGVNDMYIFNNIFWYPEGQIIFGNSGDTSKLKGAAKFYNNAYAGGFSAAEGDEKAVTVLDPGLVGPGSAPEENETKEPVTGASGSLDGYQLSKGSILIDAGVTMDDVIAHFGGEVPVDGRMQSPRELFDAANADEKGSIAYIMGDNFPVVNGVNYHMDFFGNDNLTGTKPDIGAAEYHNR